LKKARQVRFFSPEEKNACVTQGQWDALMSFTCNLGAADLGSSTLKRFSQSVASTG